MLLNVLYFAHVRQVVGRTDERLDLAAGATVADAVAALVERHPGLGPLAAVVRVAVDGEFAAGEQVLTDGAELVLIPPVSGGAGTPPVALTREPLDAARHRALVEVVSASGHGGIATFVGVVRDHARGRAVTHLEYQAYEAMAVKQLTRIVAEAEAAYPGTRVAIHHRVGLLEVGETAVIIAAGSAHRAEAFGACQRVIDRVKEDVPIWKREVGPDGAQWVSEGP
ncbi:MAG: molybdenum cofactor biosynthesis protein MoaE [Proteobacteria bacterium]|nr:MAG: molybdenum cofactor biosynthesis protein MoaE [Pseudomonadota bacterium]